MPEWIAKYWIEWVFGILCAILAGLYKSLASKLKRQKEEQGALRDGMRALLMRSIEEDCEAAQKRGWCSVEKKKIVSAMYASYHALGGNDVITQMKNDMMRLPTKPGDAA